MKRAHRIVAGLFAVGLAVLIVPVTPARGGPCEDKCASKRKGCENTCDQRKYECIAQCGIPMLPGYSQCTDKCNTNRDRCGMQCTAEEKVCEVQCKVPVK